MREGDTPLIDAARHGRLVDVAALLAGGADVNEPKTNGDGITPLFIACAEGHTEVRSAEVADRECATLTLTRQKRAHNTGRKFGLQFPPIVYR